MVKQIIKVKAMTTVARTQLKAGDKVSFHGATFEIQSTKEARGLIDGLFAYDSAGSIPGEFIGPSPVAVALGKWIDGEIITGYFGPNRDYLFQGNHRATVARI